jgi:hypothetical protein
LSASAATQDLVLGVDPGITGAFALIERESKHLVMVFDTPRTAHGEDLDAKRLAAILEAHAPLIRFAMIEDVSAMVYTQVRDDGTREKRGQGAAASFAFGRYTGIVHGILAALEIPTFLVKPAVWKVAYQLTSDKSRSLALAAERFPAHASSFSLKKHDGRAEAALLALFGAERIRA